MAIGYAVNEKMDYWWIVLLNSLWWNSVVAEKKFASLALAVSV